MKRFLPSAALTLFSLLGLGAHEAQASHAQGGDLRYESLGNNQYRVTCRFFRDCSGIPAPASLMLDCRVAVSGTTVCNATSPQNFTAPLILQGQPIYGSQYCATVTGICTNNGPDNYEENTYSATVTLPSNQWVLSTRENARPTLANIASQNDLYFEATLDNRNGLANTSPNFGSLPALFVPFNQFNTVAATAFDVDGDSLVYSLVSPLDGCGQPSAYRPVPVIPAPGGATCTPGYSTPLPATYTPTFPLPSFQYTGACPNLTGSQNFTFNSSNGVMGFTPVMYTPVTATTPSSQGLNKYVVVVKIDEWRRVNGAYRNVGSVRREMFLNVYDCGTNQMPRFANTMQVFNMGAIAANTVIPVRSGSATSLVINANDGNTTQVLSFSANSLGVPGVYSQQTGPNTMVVEFTPPASLPDGTYYVTIKVEDNNCPIKGIETRTMAFRVYNSALSARDKAPALVSTAYPNPFADEVRFTLARPASAAASTVEVVDQLGRVVERLPVPAGAGPEATLTWRPSATLPAGVYLARFPQGQQTVRLMYLAR